jgi:chemotaxis methyl-accepting protein methylase
MEMLNVRVFGRSPVGAFLRVNERLWGALPLWMTRLGSIRAYGNWLHAIARMLPNRRFYFGTFFLRNRPQLELARRISDRIGKRSGLEISILACSIGAEVYSILWTLHPKQADLKIIVNAVDVSKEALEFGQNGAYPLGGCELTDEKIFARVTNQEKLGLFDDEGDRLRIKAWLREGITWRVGDAADSHLVDVLGPQDMVFANNFLCHMYPEDAESCLRNVAKLVKPRGYLFVSGIDLDVRTRVMRDLMFEPVTDLTEDIHNGDPSLLKDWPFRYWGLEPFDKRRRDWQIRYSSVFRRQ